MEIFNEIWVWLVAALGGISMTSIITAVIIGCLKGAFNKIISKINVEKIADDATNKGIEKVKKISFEQSIQPIVESELKKITEAANEYIKTSLIETQKRYDKIIAVLEKFYAYFDDSLVSETKKQELKQALEEAKTKSKSAQSVVVEEIVEPTPKQAVEPKTERKSTTKVER